MVKLHFLILYSAKERNMLKIQYTVQYQEWYQRLTKKQPEFAAEIDLRERWFRKNPEYTRLYKHKLRKRMAGTFKGYTLQGVLLLIPPYILAIILIVIAIR